MEQRNHTTLAIVALICVTVVAVVFLLTRQTVPVDEVSLDVPPGVESEQNANPGNTFETGGAMQDQAPDTLNEEPPQDSDTPVACTMDAKICPDGSAVGRIPPTCEFAPCPEPVEEVVCTKDVQECPDGSYVSRVPPSCAFAPCPLEEAQVYCTQDVKECPDGSYVGRVPPSCAFAPCPTVPVIQNIQF